MIWLLLSMAGAGSVRATVQVGPEGAVVLHAVHNKADVAATPGALQVRDASGKVLATSAIPDPRLRSVIGPDGGGEAARVERDITWVNVPWPDGASTLGLVGRQQITPKPPPPPTAVALQQSGPSDERLDIVFLGDGYTAGQLGAYAADVDEVVAHLRSVQPYDSYKGAFNIWRIDSASTQSGASHYDAGQNITRDTAYGCYYGCSGIDRLLCCDSSAVFTDVNAAVPGADGVMVLVNDPTYGGAGGFGGYATSYNGDAMNEVAAHEVGHSLIGLWDEYDYGYTGDPTGQAPPNCAASPSAVPWEHWTDQASVDAYRECSFSNAYRPTDAGCMMRSLQDDYCPVCREQAVLAIYDSLPRLIVGADPAPGTLVEVHDGDEPLVFQIEAVGPDSGLQAEWTFDGEVISTNLELELTGCSDLDGELTLTVLDDTPWVRLDPNDRLIDSATWTVLTDSDCVDPVDTGESELFDDIAEACGCSAAGGASGLGLVVFALGLVGVRRSR
jgi:hypothetical protein